MESFGFSTSQWEFLAALEALTLDGPVCIDAVSAIVPLAPSQLLQVLEVAGKAGWVRRRDSVTYELFKDLPPEVWKTLREVGTAEKASAWVDLIERTGSWNRLERHALASLLFRAGRCREAADMEGSLVQEALDARDLEGTLLHLGRLVPLVCGGSEDGKGTGESCRAFLARVIQFSDLCFSQGRMLADLPSFMEEASFLAERLGDQRRRALLDLHLGRYFYFSDQREKALFLLSQGRAAVEKLGDEDILSQAAEFLGLLYYMQGDFRRAIDQFEQALSREEGVLNPMAPLFMAVSAAALGQFHRAIGILDSSRRRAEREGRTGVAATFQAELGIVLLQVKKKGEALFHLEAALREAIQAQNAMARYLARGGMAYALFLEGRLGESRDMLAEALGEAEKAGIVRQYGSAFVLEILYEFKRLGYEPVPEFNFDLEVEKVTKGDNAHLRGVAFRLLAVQARSAKREEEGRIAEYLAASERDLTRSGDPVQLAKTLLEMARLEISKGNRFEASGLVDQAWEKLSGYGEEFFPDDLRYLLDILPRGASQRPSTSREGILQRFLDLMEELVPSPEPSVMLHRAVATLNRFLGAERGALFWFGDRSGRRPILRAGINLTQEEVTSKAFERSLSFVLKAFHRGEPLMVREGKGGKEGKSDPARAIVCLPVETEGKIRAVLYYDNSYLTDCFDFLDSPLLMRLVRYVSVFIDRIWRYGQLMDERSRQLSSAASRAEPPREGEILFRSARMEELLEQAHKIGASESTVLLLGETGVGKELLAKRIHQVSPRREGPFVVLDVTTVPESLLESELFGHEKGAFTGADRRRTGRIELAHQGTLFLDELGELPLSLQGKLLRVLEERTVVRIGGARATRVDFRLVGATNRNLEEEVTEGRFRKDLYYRLNVARLTIPPLRERPEDVTALARHFLSYYCRALNRADLVLTAADEKRLLAYHWPGNVRELKNMMERAVLLSDGRRLDLNLPEKTKLIHTHPFADAPTLDELQRRYIRHVLYKTGGKIRGPGGAAEWLGMNRTTLYSRMKKLGLR